MMRRFETDGRQTGLKNDKYHDPESLKKKQKDFRTAIAILIVFGMLILIAAIVFAGLYGSGVLSNTGTQTFMQSCTTTACDRTKNLFCISSMCQCALSGNYWNGFTCTSMP